MDEYYVSGGCSCHWGKYAQPVPVDSLIAGVPKNGYSSSALRGVKSRAC
jgi:hypothetical protein